MFSHNDATTAARDTDILWAFVDQQYLQIVKEFSFSGLIMVKIEGENDFEILSCINLAIEPFQGKDKCTLVTLINSIMLHYKKAHRHKIQDDTHKRLSDINKRVQLGKYVLYVPMICEHEKFIALCFVNNEKDGISNILLDRLTNALLITKSIEDNEILHNRLATLEKFVKEVGHDFSSSVQAITSKLTHISKGTFSGDMVNKKAKEIEDEVWAAYRHAENLGIVVDPEYRVDKIESFDINDVLDDIFTQFRSEAEERHITIQCIKHESPLFIKGDRFGIASALGQYVINAIKYAFGGTLVRVKAIDQENKVTISVINTGIPLRDEECIKIWKFGIRGRDALDRHVNGSGIGLFTVKKIISAHGGYVSVSSINNKESVRFTFTIPKNGTSIN